MNTHDQALPKSPAPKPQTPRGPASSWSPRGILPSQERRKHRRFHVERPGKVFRRTSQQFAAARSCDLSFSGALLEVESARPFNIGEIVDLGLAMSGGSVVPASCLVQAIVVRATAIDEARHTIAVRYINSGAAQLTS